MLFVELRFFLFYAIVLTLYWSLAGNSARKNLLLAASYVFYAAWDWRFAFMLFGISTGDYLFARAIARSEQGRKRWLIASLAMNLSVLGYFKYTNFFLDSAVSLAQKFGVALDHPTLHILLPVGISFITFQSLSYTIDVYRRQLAPAKSLRDYLMFASFFPQLVAGPIVRPAYFLPQLEEKRTPHDIRHYLLLFLLGFVKKTCLADNAAPFVDQVFAAPHLYGQASIISATWLYAVQIYGDFSGYTDMAIAVAGLLGYKLTLNFNAPYLATSIQDFWRRWHISLSTWIRDYIYIPLGGRSHNRLITYRNLMLTMLAGGLWHGAAWTFVAWGGWHGAGLTANREWVRRFVKDKPAHWLRSGLGWFVTLQFVLVGWIFFRAGSFDLAATILHKYVIPMRGVEFIPCWLIVVPPILLLLELLARRLRLALRWAALAPTAFAVLYGISWALVLALLPLGSRPFIYFQF